MRNQEMKTLIGMIFAGDEPSDDGQRAFCRVIGQIANCADANERNELAESVMREAYATTGEFREVYERFCGANEFLPAAGFGETAIEVHNEQ